MKTSISLWFSLTFLLGMFPVGARAIYHPDVSLSGGALLYAFGTGELLVVSAVLAGNALERLTKRVVHVGVGASRLRFANCMGGNILILVIAVLLFAKASQADPTLEQAAWSTAVCAAAGLAAVASVCYSEVAPKAGFIMTSGNDSVKNGKTLNLVAPINETATVDFDAVTRSSAIDDGAITAWQWTINKVPDATTPTFSKSFLPNKYVISLTVTDDQGVKSFAVRGTINVTSRRS